MLPAKALEAVRQGKLHLCVIALLAERTYSRKVFTPAILQLECSIIGICEKFGVKIWKFCKDRALAWKFLECRKV